MATGDLLDLILSDQLSLEEALQLLSEATPPEDIKHSYRRKGSREGSELRGPEQKGPKIGQDLMQRTSAELDNGG